VPGIQEIFILVIIVLAILLVPRMMGRREESVPVKPAVSLSGAMRLAIAASLFWPAIMAAVFKPWRQDPVAFFYVGLGPVALAWIIFWVSVGFRRNKL